MSTYDVDHLLTTTPTQLTNKLLTAQEVNQRVTFIHVNNNRQKAEALAQSVNTIADAFSTIQKHIEEAERNITNSMDIFRQRISFHMDRGLKGVKFCIERDYLRGWQVFEERALIQITQGYFGFLEEFSEMFKAMQMLPANETSGRFLAFSTIISKLKGKLAMVRIVDGYINKTELAYRNGDPPLQKFYYTHERRYDMDYLPFSLLNKSEHQTYDYGALVKDIYELTDSIQAMMNLTDYAFNSKNVSSAEVEELSDAYAKACRGYYYYYYY